MSPTADSVKPGHLYLLTQPSNPRLYKIGVTTLAPLKRLAQHNTQLNKHAGRIVNATGQKWVLKIAIAVTDPYHAESVFWGATPLAVFPFRGGVEVQEMEDAWVEAGLAAVRKAGLRPPPQPLADWVYAYTALMRKRLEGRDISLIGRVNSMVSGKADFLCVNGHRWRTRALFVADGKGCPECGVGARAPDDVRQTTQIGHLRLLVHPEHPGMIRLSLTRSGEEQRAEKEQSTEWQQQRYRSVEYPFDLELARSCFWKLLSMPPQPDDQPVAIELRRAEQAIRELVSEMQRVIAQRERALEADN